MVHQFQQIKVTKNNTSLRDVLIHIDFSENYLCKYAEEVQCANFGGVKPEITLQTVMAYQGSLEQCKPSWTSTGKCKGKNRTDKNKMYTF